MTHLFNKTLTFLVVVLALISGVSQATIVEFHTTNHGSFRVNLHDKTTPLTVANFLQYITSERYTNSIIHRSEKNFVIQGGGFRFNDTLPLEGIETFSPVKNEPVYSNVRGTIAMAKQANNPDSATSQWFISLSDNSKNLDVQNGGFTVFGEIIAEDMHVFDDISNLPLCSQMSTASGYKIDNVPVINNSTNSCATPGADNFVTIYQIDIIDDADNTDVSLSSTKNTLINQSPNTDNGSDGGGSVFWLLLLLLPVGLRQLKS